MYKFKNMLRYKVEWRKAEFSSGGYESSFYDSGTTNPSGWRGCKTYERLTDSRPSGNV